MSVQYINRRYDEEIIDIVRSVLDNGSGKAESAYEHILIKLMQIRNTPIINFEFDQDRVDYHYNQWRKEDKETISLRDEHFFKCKKCCNVDVDIKYSISSDLLICKCKRCEYTWSEDTMDTVDE